MKKAFWLLALGALASAVMAASLGRAQDVPRKDTHQTGEKRSD